MLHMHPLVLALASAGLTGLAAPLWAQEPPSPLPASPLPAGTSSAAPLLADAATLRAVTVSATRTERTIDEVPVTVTGVGSNLLVRDGGIPGVVIRLSANPSVCVLAGRGPCAPPNTRKKAAERLLFCYFSCKFRTIRGCSARR